MKYLLILLFSFTLQAQSLLLLFSGEETPVTLPTWDWTMKPNEQMFTGGVPTLGADVLSGWNFTSGWELAGTGSVTDNNTFATSATGGIYKPYGTLGVYYLIKAVGVTTATALRIQNMTRVPDITGTFNVSYVAKKETSTNYYLYNTSAGTTDITTLTAHPLTNFTPPTYVNDYSLGGIVEGSELITNGDFSAWTGDNPNNWTVGVESGSDPMITESSGKCRLYTSGAVLGMYQDILTPASRYLYSLDIDTVVSGSIRLAGTAIYAYWSTIGTKTGTFTADNSKINIIRNDAAVPNDVTFDNVSLKPLTNGIPGTFNGGMETAQPGTNSTGIEKGFVFDGVNDYISVECTTSSTVSSLSFWINFSNTGSEKYICGTTTGYIRKSSSEVIQASSGTIYLDGALYGGSAISTGWHLVTVSGITLSGTVLNVGASITPGGYLSGFIGNAHRYSGTMTAAQVKKLYDDEKAGYQ